MRPLCFFFLRSLRRCSGEMSRCCSQCGHNGHNSRTCAESGGGDGGSEGIMLFGVRVTVDSMRKSVSLNNLSQYEQPHESSNADATPAAGYVSADDVAHHSSGNRERKRGSIHISDRRFCLFPFFVNIFLYWLFFSGFGWGTNYLVFLSIKSKSHRFVFVKIDFCFIVQFFFSSPKFLVNKWIH